jgi:energy-coupling factor transporter ATP-binding protein EcfA2
MIVGRSGCGKTTALRSINGLIPHVISGHATGEVWLDGKSVRETPLPELSRSVASVFQQVEDQFFGLTAEDELELAAESRSLAYEADRRSSVAAALEMVGLSALSDALISSMSNGQLQRLAIAEAVLLMAPVITMDEPSANLDEEGQLLLANIIATMLGQGRALVIAEHRWSYLKKLISKVVILDAGQTLASGHASLLDDQRLRAHAGLRSSNKWFARDDAMQWGPERPALQFRSVTFAYRGKTVIDQLIGDFGARTIQCVGGSNGSGKTTLGRLACGLLKEQAGDIYCYELRRSPRARRKLVGLTFHCADHQLFMPTVRAEIEYPLSFLGVGDLQLRVDVVLRQWDLEKLEFRHPHSLSGGEKQRLAIAATLATGRAILFLDEPTSGLDADHMRELTRQLKALADDGHCIILATHDYEFIAELGGEIAILDGGCLRRGRLVAVAPI